MNGWKLALLQALDPKKWIHQWEEGTNCKFVIMSVLNFNFAPFWILVLVI
jgi:hypothetical protein